MSSRDDLGIEIIKCIYRGIKNLTRHDVPGILGLSVGLKALGLPSIIAPLSYIIVKGLVNKPIIHDGFAIMNKEIKGKQVIYTLKTFKPLEDIQASKGKLEHFWNTDIVRFEQHGTDKRTVFVITQKGLKTTEEYKVLNALSDYNPVSLQPVENDFFKTYRFKLNCDFKTLTSNLNLLKTYLQARVTLNYPYISIRYRKKSKIVTLPDMINKANSGLLLGVNRNTGDPYSMDWAQAVHMLVAGMTGAGKSVCLNTIIMSAMYYDSDMSWLMFDGKLVELKRYARFLNVHYTNDIDEFRSLLDKVLEIMKCRYEESSRQGITDYPGARLIVCVDEIAVIRNTLGKKNDDISPKLRRIVNEGRAAGVHLLMFTQRPQFDQMDVNLRESVPTKIGMYMSKKDAKAFMEIEGLDQLIRGEAIVKNMHAKDLAEVQIAFSKENQYTEVFDWVTAHYDNKTCLAKIPGGNRKLKPTSDETISIIDHFKSKTGMRYKLVRNIVDRFVESLAGLPEMPKTSDHLAGLGLEEQPRKLRELKEWATEKGLLGKINKTKYKINQEEIKKYLAKTSE